MKRPDFSEEQLELFAFVLRLFNQHGVPYAVSGALALHEHTGIWRTTKDLDLFLPAGYLQPALDVLSKVGMETEVLDSVWIGKARHDGHLIDLITGMSNGAMTVDTSWIDRSLRRSLFGIPARILAIEEMIASKVFIARRERFDGADICHLIFASRGAVDWERVLALTSEKGEQSGILLWHLVLFAYVYPAAIDYVPRPIWDKLLSRLRRNLDDPDRSERFRGTLIDEKMFNVDVVDWGLPDIGRELRRERRAEVGGMSDLSLPFSSDERQEAGPEELIPAFEPPTP